MVQTLWNHCNVLRDDGMSYGNYVERLTCQQPGTQALIFGNLQNTYPTR